MKRVLWIAKFAAIQVILLFGVVEIALRVLEPRIANLRVLLYMPSVASEFDRIETLPDLLNQTIIGFNPYEKVAGFVRNSRGFRTREYAAEKGEGVLRIVVIGDSFTFSSGGIPYSDAWHVLLEEELQRGRTDRVELLNLGVPGIGPLFERRLWQIEGARLEPDVLLLVLFIGNDFTDHHEIRLEKNVTASVARWSYAVRLVRNAARVLQAGEEFGTVASVEGTAAEGAGNGGTPGAAATTAAGAGEGTRRGGYELPEYREHFATRRPLFTHERLMTVESQRARLCARAQRDEFLDLFRRLTTVVADFHDEVEAAGVDFRVVVIPDRFQVNVDERNEVLELLGMTEEQFYHWDMPQRQLNAFFEREGISYLDLLPAFREASRTGQMYDPGNTHWNIEGNALAAREIAAWLKPRLPSVAQ